MTQLLTPPNATPTRSIDDWIVGSDLFPFVAVDLYRDIHKGIRGELFTLVERAGSTDPYDRTDRLALTDHVLAIQALLESHASHEDAAVQPVLERELPDLAERVEHDHDELERRFASIAGLAAEIDLHRRDHRRIVQMLYLDLGRFVAEYLTHIDIEERVVMPALDAVVGEAGALEIHAAIVSSIPADEMARTLAFMLPAMNIEDQIEMLGGMRSGLTPEDFGEVIGLAASVLRPERFDQLRLRLG